MKKLISILVLLAVLATSLCLPVFATETWTKISSYDDLTEMTNSGNYKLTQDIVITEARTEFFLTETETESTDFSGVLDGDGYAIIFQGGVTLSDAGGALFKSVSGTIKNLTVCGAKNADSTYEPFTISCAEGSSGFNAGAIVGFASGTVESPTKIENVHIYADLDVSKRTGTTNAGLMFGKLDGSYSLVVDGCTINGSLTDESTGGDHSLGGLVGKIDNTASLVVTNSVMNGNIVNGSAGASQSNGGFVGKVDTKASLVITDSVMNGNIVNESTAASHNNGGFVGKVVSAASLDIDNSEMKGTVSATNKVANHNNAGFLGWFNTTGEVTIDNCINSGKIENAAGRVGGFVGCTTGSETGSLQITASVNSATINVGSNAGGFVGYDNSAVNTSSVTISKCTNTGSITAGSNHAGGIVGFVNGLMPVYIHNSVNSGNIKAATTAGGAIAVFNNNNNAVVNGKISGFVNMGDVTGSTRAGGVIAQIMGASGSSFEISGCRNDGKITAARVGGIAGHGGATANIAVSNCTNTGIVVDSDTGTADGGYILGGVFGPGVNSVSNCFNLTASSESVVNGLYGTSTATASDCEDLTSTELTDLSSIEMVYGAAVRFDANAERQTGIRFTINVDKDAVMALVDKYGATNVELGALIAPESYVAAAGNVFTLETVTNSQVLSGNLSEGLDEDKYYASLAEVYSEHYNDQYSCIGFIRFRTSETAEWITVYTEYSAEANARSVSQISTSALADTDAGYSDNQVAILQTLVEKSSETN